MKGYASMALNKVYEDAQFIILGGCGEDYILINKRKKFKQGHTHLHNYKTAHWLTRLYKHKSIPRNLHSTYLLESLIRISDDDVYTTKIKELLEVRKQKKKPYYINVQKGSKKLKSQGK